MDESLVEAPDTEVEDPSEEQKEAERAVEARKWLDKIKAREKIFEDGWWKAAKNVTEIYESEKPERVRSEVPYNILYSNTEVLLPSLYSATPRPDVRGKYKDQDIGPITQVTERFLTVAADPGTPGLESLNDAMKDATISALVPGLGYVRLRSYPERDFPLAFESGHYKSLIWGYSRKWSKVPWVAFRHELTRDEFLKQFKIPEDEADDLTISDTNFDEDGTRKEKREAVIVYELWVKKSREVIFLCEDWEDLEVQRNDDEMKLSGFYPIPGPLVFSNKAGNLIPTPVYEYYRNQAEELNRVTVRLNKVLSALRVRGAYNPLLGQEIEQILSAENVENGLVPANEAGLLAQTGGFEKQIWFLPLEKLITVAQQLYIAREQIKGVIYELTGISDIIRGSSVASETATAQNLKNKWGTIRLRTMQSSVADYVKDLFRMAVDCGANIVPAEKWKEIIQLPIPLEVEKQAAMQQMQSMQMMQQMGMQLPPPDPKMQEVANAPFTMEMVLKQLSTDANRTFTIDIETSSTIDLDTAVDKEEVSDFMNALGQLVNGLQPLGAMGQSGVNVVKEILVAICQRFKFGLQIIDSIKALEAPPPEPPKGPPPPTPEEQQVAQAESQFALQKIAAQQAELQAKGQLLQEQTKLEMEKIQADRVKMQIDVARAQLTLKAQQDKLAAQKAQQNATVPA